MSLLRVSFFIIQCILFTQWMRLLIEVYGISSHSSTIAVMNSRIFPGTGTRCRLSRTSHRCSICPWQMPPPRPRMCVIPLKWRDDTLHQLYGKLDSGGHADVADNGVGYDLCRHRTTGCGAELTSKAAYCWKKHWKLQLWPFCHRNVTYGGILGGFMDPIMRINCVMSVAFIKSLDILHLCNRWLIGWVI